MTLLASLSTEYQVPSFKYRVSHTQQSQQVSIRLKAPLVETLSSEGQNQRIGEGHVGRSGESFHHHNHQQICAAEVVARLKRNGGEWNGWQWQLGQA